MKELRTTRRYDVSLPVFVRVRIEKEAFYRTGKTRDISSRGVYFTIGNDFSSGAELDLKMTLPAEITGGTEVFILRNGTVRNWPVPPMYKEPHSLAIARILTIAR